MSGELKLLDAGELDYEAYARLQRTAFAEIFRKNKVSDAYLTGEFFRWKYHTSSGPGKIAVVFEGGEMVAANAMMRYSLQTPMGPVAGWQSCDTASLPVARGKGYFKRCLQGLLTLMKPDELFFGFPNANSRKGFLGIGWTEVSLLDTFVKPWFLSPWRSLGAVTVGPEPEEGTSEFLRQWMRQQRRALVVRDGRYLQWRYFSMPNSPYQAFYLRSGGEVVALAIARMAQVTGRKVVLVMEAMGLSAGPEGTVREAVARWGFGQGASLAVDINSHQSFWQGLRGGFVRVPQRLLPKRNVLMGHSPDPAVAEQLRQPFYVSVGDWDGF